tara:strand:- start:4050 stop:6011 length:1962 start_codon:yes stop_codon:yes gene_type:complete
MRKDCAPLRKAYIFGIILTLCGVSYSSQAGQHAQDLQSLLQLDLEQLAEVSVASKRSEPINQAPAIVSVITADEISRFGYRNLRDVLDRQTSIQIIGSNLFPHNKASARGVSSTHIDNNVLILLNGRPIRESSVSSINHDIYAYFPVASLKQIEIIRGPGSVLYGTNAFSGAINLVTKEAPDSPEGNLSLGYGSFDSKQIQLSGGGKWGELEVFGAIQGIKNNGDNRDNIIDELGSAGTYKTGKEGEQLLLNLKYKGFTLNALQSDTSSDNNRSTFTFPSTQHQYERQFIDVAYQHNLTDSWSITTSASYHHHNSNLVLNSIPNIAKDSANNYLFELSTAWTPSTKLHFITGSTYRLFSNQGAPSFDTNAYSFYTQADYQVLDWLKLIGGLQYNKPEKTSGDFSPRIAAIIKFDNYWGSKLLFGKAFREASPLERLINNPAIRGNPNLDPETIETFNAQLFYNSQSLFFAASYFHSEQTDLITRIAGTPVTTVNAGGITYDGFELEAKWQINDRWSFIGNVSYQTNESDNDANDVSYAPDWMAKTGVTYNSDNGYQLSLFNSFFAASTLQNHQVATVTVANPDADGYNLLTANININLGQTLNNKNLSGITLTLYADNLLDEDIFFPSINRTSVNSIPHHYRRGFYGAIKINF